MSPGRGAAVVNGIAWPSETAHARAAGFDRLEALTLIFSAKESIFKCLSGRVGRTFGFHDVRVVGVDGASRSFQARVVTNLAAEFPAQTYLEGTFEVRAPWIHTAMVLPRRLAHVRGASAAASPANGTPRGQTTHVAL